MKYTRKKTGKDKLRTQKHSERKKLKPVKNKKSSPETAFMLQTKSILTPEEIQLCLVLQCLVQELAIFIGQNDVLDGTLQSFLLMS